MRIGLVPLQTHPNRPDINLQHFMGVIQTLVAAQPLDLVILPECALTGYVYRQDDLARFAEPVPGPTTEMMANIARQFGIGICFGLVERSSAGIFNTAVLLGRDGEIQLTQRKISEKPPYAAAHKLNVGQTEFGKIAILTCGDLFDERAARQVPPDLDLLLTPMARGFDKKSPDPRRWENEERQFYLEAVKQIGVTTAIVNALDVGVTEGSFGGAMVVDGAGQILAESPHGTDLPLVYEL